MTHSAGKQEGAARDERSFSLCRRGKMSLSLPSMPAPARLAPLGLRMSDESYARDATFIGILAEAKGDLHVSRRKEKNGSNSSSSSAEVATGSSSRLRSSSRVAAGLGPKPFVTPTQRRKLDPIQDQVMKEELLAKRRVYKLRNELQHSRSTAAIMDALARKERAAQHVREETRMLQGAHLSGSVQHVPPATIEQVSEVATALMKHLVEVEPEPSKRSWFKLFKDFDLNGDGHISFAELMEMIRVNIKMPASKISDKQVMAVWHSIDLDGNGWIDAGEFGRFFRQGEKPSLERRQHEAENAKRALQQEAEKSGYREPTLAEMAIKNSRRTTYRLESEEALLKQNLHLSISSSGVLPKSASLCLATFPRNSSNQSLPPMRSNQSLPPMR